jgi:hypothetical protein
MKKLFLIIVAILFALPVYAGECEETYKVYKAEINGVSTYRLKEVMRMGDKDLQFTIKETGSLESVMKTRDALRASCQATKDAEIYHKMLENAKWEEMK